MALFLIQEHFRLDGILQNFKSAKGATWYPTCCGVLWAASHLTRPRQRFVAPHSRHLQPFRLGEDSIQATSHPLTPWHTADSRVR